MPNSSKDAISLYNSFQKWSGISYKENRVFKKKTWQHIFPQNSDT